MKPELPTRSDLQRLATSLGLMLNDEELEAYLEEFQGKREQLVYLAGLESTLSRASRPIPQISYPDTSSNPYGAWHTRFSLSSDTRTNDLLLGKRIAIKDNVSIAGVPMSIGSVLLKGYIPKVDATLITRILESGGTIVGTTTCEDLCSSGGSHTSHPSVVRNPNDWNRMAGGSSSGSAVVVKTGEADIAIGADQGGSVRIPSSWCGVFGLKPTWGLIPYTGVASVDPTLDHVGPIARTVDDLALALEALAGLDGHDHRQRMAQLPVHLPHYLKGSRIDPKGLRVAVLQEGFHWPGLSEDIVDRACDDIERNLVNHSVHVSRVSIPLHTRAAKIWGGIAAEGTWAIMYRDNTNGYGYKGFYNTDLAERWADTIRSAPDQLPTTVKFNLLYGAYLGSTYHGHFYGVAQNALQTLTDAYDRVLQEYDALLLPTTPQRAPLFPDPDSGIKGQLDAAYNMVCNVAPFNATGHPALNVPIAAGDGLPIGYMLVANRFRDDKLLRLARCFESEMVKST